MRFAILALAFVPMPISAPPAAQCIATQDALVETMGRLNDARAELALMRRRLAQCQCTVMRFEDF